MKKYLIVIVSFSIMLLAGCSKNASDINKEENSTSGSSKGSNNADNINADRDKAPDFSLAGPSGKTVSLSDFKGKVVIVDFWATWCPPCRRGIPDLIDLQTQFGDKLAVIGISVDTDTKDRVASFAQNFNINYTVLFATPEVVQAYGSIQSIPTSFIIDKNGKIVNQHVGLTPKEIYISEIKKLLD
jgi:cytochrome c biogenesis protein CcmG/thiol:disulfide interchange protein DsbE